RLAADSARFVNGYVPTSVCRPSLATLLTGLYPHQHGIHFNHPPDPTRRAEAEHLVRSVPTLPRLLAEVGYRSFQTGKHWEGDFRNAGFTDGMTLGQTAEIEREYGLRPAHGNGDAGLAIGRKTLQPIYDFVESCGETPFLVWYAPFLPHTPQTAPQRFVDMYKDRSDVPADFRTYYASITWFDHTVGELLDWFEKGQLLDNTLVVFVVDNGWAPRAGRPDTNDPRTKWSPFELGVRTPILLRWQGRTRPATHTTLVSSVDLVPTLLHAAGLASKTAGLPGSNLLPAAEGRSRLPDRPVFGEIYANQARRLGQAEREVLYRWVRSGDHKLIVPQGRVQRAMLFNVTKDPQEAQDLAAEASHAELVLSLQRTLDQWWDPATGPVSLPPAQP
ncbi:MAG: sulfatase-like hydrolase/transferase, partial [Planctomycetes bacterium]|nr:sulfatase-like hydrolase/transferase [Planctomycetota bacterium]